MLPNIFTIVCPGQPVFQYVFIYSVIRQNPREILFLMFSSGGRLAKKAANIIHYCMSRPTYLPVCVYQQLNCPVERQNARDIFNFDVFL